MSIKREMDWLLQEKHHGQKTEAFTNDCMRLQAGEPLAYLIGWIPFLDCRIYLDSKPLIPRSETEYWTELAIAEIKKADVTTTRPLCVLDLGAGSGAIGVAVAKALPRAHVTFAEIDSTHLPTIKRNLEENLSVNRRVFHRRTKVVTSDLFSSVRGVFNFILTNPPYIDPTLDRTQNSVKDHEPAQALYGGTDGLACITSILAEAASYLAPQGQLWIEHEPEQEAALAALAQKYNWHVTSHSDQYRTIRYSVFQQAVPE